MSHKSRKIKKYIYVVSVFEDIQEYEIRNRLNFTLDNKRLWKKLVVVIECTLLNDISNLNVIE